MRNPNQQLLVITLCGGPLHGRHEVALVLPPFLTQQLPGPKPRTTVRYLPSNERDECGRWIYQFEDPDTGHAGNVSRTPLLDEWAARAALRSNPEAVAARITQLRADVLTAPGYTVDDAVEAVAAFLLTDPTLPALPSQDGAA